MSSALKDGTERAALNAYSRPLDAAPSGLANRATIAAISSASIILAINELGR